jgi:hypothetical protein
MRYLFGFLCVCALGVMGCSETAGTGGNGGDGGSAGTGGVAGAGGTGGNGEPCWLSCPCQRPLDHYCKGSDCPSWEEAVADAEKRAMECDCDGGMWPAAFGAGRCGDLRYVRRDCGDEYIEYFDASGTLVAAYWWTDGCGSVCPGSCAVDYGLRPECEREQEQDFCDQDG